MRTPLRSLACLAVVAFVQGPPPGSPFPPAQDMHKLQLLVGWLKIGRDDLGWTDTYTLECVAWLYQVYVPQGTGWRPWRLSDGVAPILVRLP